MPSTVDLHTSTYSWSRRREHPGISDQAVLRQADDDANRVVAGPATRYNLFNAIGFDVIGFDLIGHASYSFFFH